MNACGCGLESVFDSRWVQVFVKNFKGHWMQKSKDKFARKLKTVM
jgi:hypothetical protein